MIIGTKTGPQVLVTIADRAAEAMLTDTIGRLLPEADIIGEEAVTDDATRLEKLTEAGVIAILDPIDGTANSVRDNATFGMILAVPEGGRTLLGVLCDPLPDDRVLPATTAAAGSFATRPRGGATGPVRGVAGGTLTGCAHEISDPGAMLIAASGPETRKTAFDVVISPLYDESVDPARRIAR